MKVLATLDGLRIARPLDGGPDGLRFAAIDDDADVELVRLSGVAKGSAREVAIGRRLALVASLSHPASRRVVRTALEASVPYVVLEPTTALDSAAPPSEVDEIAVALAGALEEAHRLGIVHGCICASHVGRGADGRVRLDLTDLQVSLPVIAPTPPELRGLRVPTPAGDVWALGSLLRSLLPGRSDPTPDLAEDATVNDLPGGRRLRSILPAMLDADPDRRPSMQEVADALADRVPDDPTSGETPAIDATALVRLRALKSGDRLGRWVLGDPIGEGGMGRVFHARGAVTGESVAIKVLLPDRALDEIAKRRFLREAHVLSRLDCPEVARFVEANEERGIVYLVMEHVGGRTLRDILREDGPLPPSQALEVALDVAKALADVHDLGVVHRDVKPSNVIVLASPDGGRARAKLCDFGIARRVGEDTLEALTRVGHMPGTPWYMAPEQCRSEPLDPRADVYSLGATLFHALAGEPPFPHRDPAEVVAGHLAEPAPDLRDVLEGVDPAIAALVARTLEKDPAHRYADARELMYDLERARFGELVDISAHPRPGAGSERPSVYRFEWTLRSSPDELWPYVSDTERFNRAVGLSPVEFAHSPLDDGAVETRAKMPAFGAVLDWKENPFEWVAPHRLGVLREYRGGPFAWLRSTVDLEPLPSGGSKLVHTVEVAPRSALARAAASLEVGVRLRRGFGRVYRRIDEVCTLSRGAAAAAGRASGSRGSDPFEPSPRVPREVELKLDSLSDLLVRRGLPAEVVEGVVGHLRYGTSQEVAHVRPLALADRLGLDRDAVVRTCLSAASEGGLVLLWDILCPACRVPSSIVDTMAALRDHAHCEACNIDFDLDFARSVELVFRAHPSLRESELRTYCIGGPAHSPHVLAQVRLGPGEVFELEPELAEGSYKIVGRALPGEWRFRVTAAAPHDAWRLSLGAGLPADVARSLRPGRPRMALENDLGHEVIVRLERAASRSDAFTAAQAASHPLFRKLFPAELLSPGQLVGVSQVSIVFAEPGSLGALFRAGHDSQAFDRMVALKAKVEDVAALEGGTLVKLFGNGVMAVFHEPTAAVRAALAIHASVEEARIAVHTGAALVTTIDDRLDYFGRLVHESEVLLDEVSPGELLVSESTLHDFSASSVFADAVPAPTVLVREGVLAHRASRVTDRPRENAVSPG